MKITTQELKSLNETVSSIAATNKGHNFAEGYINSLTEKARQIASKKMESEEEKEEEGEEEEMEDEDEMEEMPLSKKKKSMAEETQGNKPSAVDPVEEIMKRLAARALKKAKKKSRGSSESDYAGAKPKAASYDPDMKNTGAVAEEIELAEKAAPGYEDWASDPKVKASFKKQYGKRWKQVMYGHSWNMKKMNEETEQLEEGYQAKRLRIMRKALGRRSLLSPKLDDYMKRSFKKKEQRNKQISGGKGNWSAAQIRADKKIAAMKAKGLDPLAEEMQLDEAGYKRLMRLKKAAYKAGQTGSPSHGKKMRAAAGREAQVAARMASRGGASTEAVKAGGSRIGKKGKYTQKAGKLANMRDRALARFRSTAKIARYQETGDFGGKLGKEGVAKKREMQKGMAKFRMDARHGDFGHEISPESKRISMRARYNYEKKYGRLKGK